MPSLQPSVTVEVFTQRWKFSKSDEGFLIGLHASTKKYTSKEAYKVPILILITKMVFRKASGLTYWLVKSLFLNMLYLQIKTT